jgi:hypothetical protein
VVKFAQDRAKIIPGCGKIRRQRNGAARSAFSLAGLAKSRARHAEKTQGVDIVSVLRKRATVAVGRARKIAQPMPFCALSHPLAPWRERKETLKRRIRGLTFTGLGQSLSRFKPCARISAGLAGRFQQGPRRGGVFESVALHATDFARLATSRQAFIFTPLQQRNFQTATWSSSEKVESGPPEIC